MKPRILDLVALSVALVGGTGRFVGASGHVDMTLLPNLESRWTLHFD